VGNNWPIAGHKRREMEIICLEKEEQGVDEVSATIAAHVL
jgi:hypothetical protein